MTKRIAAIVRSKPWFGPNGVLYQVGEKVPENPGVPEEDVSAEPFREKEVEYEARNGDIRKKKVRVRVPFRPVPDGSTASSPEQTDTGLNGGTFNVSNFLKKNLKDIEAAVSAGEVDDYLDAIEQGEASKGNGRAGVSKAIVARRESLDN